VCVAVLTLACRREQQPVPNASQSAVPALANAALQQAWYPLPPDAVVPIPEGCSATCVLDCDQWQGRVTCGGGVEIDVYGGIGVIGKGVLGAPGATLAEPGESLPSGARVRSGSTTDGKFCAELAWSAAGWEFCAADSAAARTAVLSIVRTHSHQLPSTRLLSCGRRTC
jgi:hypothetical protein